jgi:hypothetical protein
MLGGQLPPDTQAQNHSLQGEQVTRRVMGQTGQTGRTGTGTLR